MTYPDETDTSMIPPPVDKPPPVPPLPSGVLSSGVTDRAAIGEEIAQAIERNAAEIVAEMRTRTTDLSDEIRCLRDAARQFAAIARETTRPKMDAPADRTITDAMTSVADNRISAIHPTGMHILRTQAHLAGWSIAKDSGLTVAQSDAIIDAGFDAVIALLRKWEQSTGSDCAKEVP